MAVQPNQDFPRDPAKFKAWADAECVRWPNDLTWRAYDAHIEMVTSLPSSRTSHIDVFAEAYRAHVLSGSSA